MQDPGGAVLMLRWPLLPLPPASPPEPACQECGGPIVGRRRGARFCGGSCRVKSAGKAFRQRKRVEPSSSEISELTKAHRRLISDSAAVVHPDEVQRPFDTSLDDEPPWVTSALAPPRLSCEPEPPAPEPSRPFWRLD
jgi:hypothetical protein